MAASLGHVRFNPNTGHWSGPSPQQTTPLFDHLVGAGDKRGRDGEAERLGGLEKLWDGGEGVASSLPVKLMEMPHDNPCKRYESIPRRL
jgi:hypothetical protein